MPHTVREVIARVIWKPITKCDLRSVTNRSCSPVAECFCSRLVNERADSILAALERKGYVIVPKEPSEAMKRAGGERVDMDDSSDELADRNNAHNAGAVYRAMIAAHTAKE